MIIPNDTPGVTINPIINICGNHSFNEVFYDDVRVPKRYVVGEVNRGFYNVMLALQFERMSIGSGGFRRVLEELVQFARETTRSGRPLSEDPRVRRALAAIAVEIEVFLTFYWQSAWMQDRGQVPELEASALKLIFTELSVKLADTAVNLLGPYGLLDKGSKWAPFGGRVGMGYLDSISGPIGAGTSEIQKNILATRGLGLPRER
jgi:alkylation response protein AidB-like acyl-CoA dehydrogenase